MAKNLNKFIIFLVALLLFTTLPSFSSKQTIEAQTYDELQEQIDEKNSDLDALQSELDNIEAQLNDLSNQKNATSSQLELKKNAIAEIDLKISKNESLIKQLNDQISLNELELDQQKLLTKKKVSNLYIASRRSRFNLFIENVDAGSFINEYSYQKRILDGDVNDIESLQSKLEGLTQEKLKFEGEIASYEEQNKLLAEEKSNLEASLNQIASNLNNTANLGEGLRGQIGAIQGQIGDLQQAQQEILDYEYWLMQQQTNIDTDPVEAGQLFFAGQGRDLYQGHGLGMSQYGAYGAAASGMTATQIMQFYYTGITVEPIGAGSVNVIGVGTMDIETYVAGLGEVPDKACGTVEQANANPSKYVVDNPNSIWDCWPEESIKAQVIAARSYALSKGGSLYPDARDQVYKGGNGKAWAASETTNQVGVYGGAIIRAYYSADNNQGHGTANHETVWSDYSGNKTPLPYLRSVDDSGFALSSDWTYWAWTTGGFDYDQLNEIMIYERDNFGYAQSFIGSVLTDVGTINNLTFVRDPSQRAWKVVLTGTNGSREIAGWLFKSMWNDAAANGVAPGYIYSLSFSILQK